MIKDWIKFNESKNYGDLYHSIWRSSMTQNQILNILSGVLENGLKFSKNVFTSSINKNFHFLGDNYFLSTTRNKQVINKYPVTFVLDGGSISNKYKIEPFNLKAPREIGISKTDRKNLEYLKSLKPGEEYKEFNGRYFAEEKIVSNKEGYLNTKYIKEIILNKPSDELIEFINQLDTKGIKITII